MFQQFNFSIILTPLDPLSLYKLVIPHFISSPLGCNLLSQYHYINPISIEFKYHLWLVSFFLLLSLTSLQHYIFSSFSMPQQLHWSWCWSFFNPSRYPMIPFILFIHQLFHVLLPWIFNPFLVNNHFTRYSFQTIWPCYILSFFYYLLCYLKNFILMVRII